MSYTHEVEKMMLKLYSNLNEKERRYYLAIEVMKLGYGGKQYIMNLFSCSHHTIDRGLWELEHEDGSSSNRIRKQGGGRKKKLETLLGINDAFLRILKDNTAGSPMDENIKWTNLTELRMAELLQYEGYNIGIKVVKQLLKKNNFKKRKPFKSIAGGSSEFRDEQFRNIECLKNIYISNGNPVISMDVKKKNS